MGKQGDNLKEFCPDCGSDNVQEESTQNLGLSCDESDCCCCCCCSCENSDFETHDVEICDERCSDGHKKDLLSNLSITKTKKQPASIQSVLQYIEALTHSGSFLNSYYSMEDFCLDCLIQPTCHCYVRSLANLNLENACTCNACCLEDGSNETQTLEIENRNCPDCTSASVSKVPSSRVPRNRSSQDRRRRRNQRQRNGYSRDVPRTSGQRFRMRRTSNDVFDREVVCSDPECSARIDGSRRHREENQRYSLRDNSFCNCEECRAESTLRGDQPCTCIYPNTLQSGSKDNVNQCNECATGLNNVSGYQNCQLSDCEECREEESLPAADLGAQCSDEDCQTCSILQPLVTECECCKNLPKTNKNFFKESKPEVKRKNDKDSKKTNLVSDSYKGGTSASECCDCDDCKNCSEYSEDSCDELCDKTVNKSDPKSKENK